VEPVAVGQGLDSCIEGDAGDESVSDGVAHLDEPSEPVRSWGLAGFDFDAEDAAVGGLEDEVYFGPGAVLPMEDVHVGVGPARLSS
jgi:hypothetical protein